MSKSSSTNLINDPRTIRGWVFFDWANSAYALVITAAIFPAYFLAQTDPIINIGSFQLSNSSLYAYSISFAYILIAIISPLLSGIADFGGKKMFFLKLFTTIGSISCVTLIFFQDMSDLFWGTVSFILATIGFAGGIVFYNSFLPDIVSEDRYDSVSAKGFAYGYVGSVILLIFNLWIIMDPTFFGISESSLAPRISFVMVGMWWFGFAQITFRRLPKDPKGKIRRKHVLLGFAGLKRVLKEIESFKNIKRFLLSYFIYNAGAQTVIFLAATFASKELGFETKELIIIILLLQLVGIVGAHFFAKMSYRRGNKKTIQAILTIWAIICIAAFFVVSKIQFYAIGALVGLVMGGIQSMSRSTYSKFVPDNSRYLTSYFSMYDILEKVSIVLGTFLFGFIEQITGNIRYSVLSLAVLFIVGKILLYSVQVVKVSK